MTRHAVVRAARAVVAAAAAVGALLGGGGTAAGQTPRLVADLVTSPIGSRPFPMLRLNGVVVFGADTVDQGRELFATDGTAAGTRMVKDLRPGGYSGLSIYTPDGGLSLFTLYGPEGANILLFAADDGVHGTELWTSDGTEAGTRMVKDINPGPGSSDPRNVFIDAGVLYFTADDGAHGLEPWRTDGTEAGTALVADVVSGMAPSRARVIGQDALGYYLTSLEPAGIWKKNFALPSAVLLHASGVEEGQSVMFDGSLLFRGTSTTQGTELWKSTGTPGGTALLADLAFGTSSSLPGSMTVYNGAVYFTAVTSSSSSGQLYRTDGVASPNPPAPPAGTVLVSGPWGTRLQAILGTFDGRLILQVGDSTGRQPNAWLSDGTGSGTTGLSGVYLARPGVSGGAGGAGPYTNFSPALFVDAGALYILGSATGGGTFAGPQVYRYPGTGTATQLVTSVGGPGPASVLAYSVLDGRVVMAGEDPVNIAADGDGEAELWAQDAPGSASSARLADLYTGNSGASLTWLRSAGSKLYFLSRSSQTPAQLSVTLGTPGTTAQYAAVNPDVLEEAPGIGPAVLGSTIFFENRTSTTGLELWASDGPPNSRLTRDISPGLGDTNFDQLTPSGPFMYFRVSSLGSSVWRSDGTTSNTGTIELTPDTGAFSNLTDVDGRLMFVGRATPSDPPGLWMSDGSPEGTARVRAFTSLSIGGTPITAVKGTGKCFFASGPLSAEGRELWMSDGREMGTARVADIVSGPGGSNPSQIVSAGVVANGEPRVLFVATTAGEGAEMWFSDGTNTGTRPVRDIRTGPVGSAISELVAVVSPTPGAGIRAYFIADDGLGGGARLWTSDGSEPGTHAVLDINPAPVNGGDDRLGNLTIARGRLYFTADDGVHGLELWMSDGTSEGTRMVADLWPGDRGGLEVMELGNPSVRPSLTAVNNRLYFVGNDGAHGNELHVLDLCPADFNNDGTSSVQDVFDFLGAFFTGDDWADVNGVGGVTVQDVFDFLGAWFAGC